MIPEDDVETEIGFLTELLNNLICLANWLSSLIS